METDWSNTFLLSDDTSCGICCPWPTLKEVSCFQHEASALLSSLCSSVASTSSSRNTLAPHSLTVGSFTIIVCPLLRRTLSPIHNSAVDNLTHGDAIFVSQEVGSSANLAYVNGAGNAIIKVDNTTKVPAGQKRNTVRIQTNDVYGVGSLWIADMTHVPYGCRYALDLCVSL